MYAVGQVPREIFQYAPGNLTPTISQSGRHRFSVFTFIYELLTVAIVIPNSS